MFVVGLCEELVLPVNKCKDLGVVLGFSFLYKHSLSFAQHLLHPVFSVSLYPNVIHIEQTNDLSGCFVAKQVFHLTWRLTDWQCSNRVKSQFYVRRGGIQGGATPCGYTCCVTGTKTEQRLVQQTCSFRVTERSKVAQEWQEGLWFEFDSWYTGVCSDLHITGGF